MRKPWALASIGLLSFAVLVWFAGPLLVLGGQAPLASPLVRALVVSVFTLQYLGQKLWNIRQARRNNERVVAGLTPALETGLSAEALQLRERFSTALAELRQTRFGAHGGSWSSLSWKFGRSYLYQLPWYMIIGAPGAGKTTALLNSGLNFPLAGKLGRGPVGGFGGTRNCDWWFTDRAVLIDTAGRYTTHDSDRIVDRQAWENFLQLLRKARPRRPLNGVLVAVSVGDLLGFSAAQLAEHAHVLRARLDELQTALRVRVPVYLLLTKCDLLPGFVDWFRALGRQERDSVWGVTFDLRAADSAGAAGGAGFFAPAFDRLVNHLADGLIDRLQAERDSQRRARIFSLPRQLRALAAPLDALVRGTFGSAPHSSDAAAPLVRGVYLTSGTQEGTPIDRVLSAFGRELGLERQIVPPNQNTGRSFFLSRLLSDVVFAEADLSRTPLRRRWQRRLLASSVAALQLCAVGVSAWWLAGYFRSTDDIARLEDEATRVHAIVAALPASSDPDPRSLLPALDAMRALAHERLRAGGPRADGPLELIDIGAGARRKLAAATADAYDRMLLGPFQARIAKAIDATLRTGADMNVQYEALKAYTMLHDAGHFDAAGFKVFVLSYWDSAVAPPLSPSERQDLGDHLAALLSAGAVGSGISVEPALVDSVRRRLNAQSGAQRIALRLAVFFELHPYADFTLASLGPATVGLFVGAGGAEPYRVPGRDTIEAYRDVLRTEVPAVAAQLASEAAWVLAAAKPDAATDVTDFMSTYRAGYAQAWARFVDDLRLRPAANNQGTIRQAQALGAPDGPLAQALHAIVRQTALRMEDRSEGPIAPTDPLADRFIALADLVTRDTQGIVTLDGVLQSFRELQTLRTLAASGSTPVGTTPLADRLARVSAEAKRQPEPVRSMLLALAVLPPENGGPANESSPATLSRQIAARLGVACIRLVAGQFPFDRRALRDAPLENFSRLFAPKGTFDEVFGQLLAARVDTSSDTWRSLAPTGPDAESLERFRSAARIRDVFFAHGGTQPRLLLTFRPLDMDPTIDRFQLEIDGQTIRYAHGPAVPTIVKWPGPQGSARIEVTPAIAGTRIEYEGPWAAFRLFDHAAIREAESPAHFEVVFDVDGRHASFAVESDSGANPFRLRELERFDCPLPGP